MVSRLYLGIRLADAFGIWFPFGVISFFGLATELGIWLAGSFVQRIGFARIAHKFLLWTSARNIGMAVLWRS